MMEIEMDSTIRKLVKSDFFSVLKMDIKSIGKNLSEDGGTKEMQSLKRSSFSRVHATLQPALLVGRSVGWSVGRSHFIFL